MLIETWVFVLIFLVVATFGAVGIAGWTFFSDAYHKQVEENKQLRDRNKMLEKRIAYRNALDNIKVADEFYNEVNKNEIDT